MGILLPEYRSDLRVLLDSETQSVIRIFFGVCRRFIDRCLQFVATRYQYFADDADGGGNIVVGALFPECVFRRRVVYIRVGSRHIRRLRHQI